MATPVDTKATVSIKVGNVEIENDTAAAWVSGENVVSVTVTNGTESKTYTVTVIKA